MFAGFLFRYLSENVFSSTLEGWLMLTCKLKRGEEREVKRYTRAKGDVRL